MFAEQQGIVQAGQNTWTSSLELLSCSWYMYIVAIAAPMNDTERLSLSEHSLSRLLRVRIILTESDI